MNPIPSLVNNHPVHPTQQKKQVEKQRTFSFNQIVSPRILALREFNKYQEDTHPKIMNANPRLLRKTQSSKF